MRELAVMKKIKHPNLVNLEAVFENDEAREIYIVMEYMPCGIIMYANTQPLSQPNCFRVIHEVPGFLDGIGSICSRLLSRP